MRCNPKRCLTVVAAVVLGILLVVLLVYNKSTLLSGRQLSQRKLNQLYMAFHPALSLPYNTSLRSVTRWSVVLTTQSTTHSIATPADQLTEAATQTEPPKPTEKFAETQRPTTVHTVRVASTRISTTARTTVRHKTATVASSPPCTLRSDAQYYWCQRGEETVDNVLDEPLHTATVNNRHNILFSIRTTKRYHSVRMGLMLDTWVSRLNATNFFIVTDDSDPQLEEKAESRGIHYINIECGKTYSRESLCCKSGEEMSLMFHPDNAHYDWYCHMDDDVYLIMENVVRVLDTFKPKTEQVYLGRPGKAWRTPFKLNLSQSLIKQPLKTQFHFAGGGFYCLSRPLLEKAKMFLGSGDSMRDTCNKLYEPEDVTVGAVVELLMNVPLRRTWRFYTSGLNLEAAVSTKNLQHQIGFTHGCGQLCWYLPPHNSINVPGALFSKEKDPSRFFSLHCYLYPKTSWCNKSNIML